MGTSCRAMLATRAGRSLAFFAVFLFVLADLLHVVSSKLVVVIYDRNATCIAHNLHALQFKYVQISRQLAEINKNGRQFWRGCMYATRHVPVHALRTCVYCDVSRSTFLWAPLNTIHQWLSLVGWECGCRMYCRRLNGIPVKYRHNSWGC